jgi:hypothetical protein
VPHKLECVGHARTANKRLASGVPPETAGIEFRDTGH